MASATGFTLATVLVITRRGLMRCVSAQVAFDDESQAFAMGQHVGQLGCEFKGTVGAHTGQRRRCCERLHPDFEQSAAAAS